MHWSWCRCILCLFGSGEKYIFFLLQRCSVCLGVNRLLLYGLEQTLVMKCAYQLPLLKQLIRYHNLNSDILLYIKCPHPFQLEVCRGKRKCSCREMNGRKREECNYGDKDLSKVWNLQGNIVVEVVVHSLIVQKNLDWMFSFRL